jgi:hypothetical protein
MRKLIGLILFLCSISSTAQTVKKPQLSQAAKTPNLFFAGIPWNTKSEDVREKMALQKFILKEEISELGFAEFKGNQISDTNKGDLLFVGKYLGFDSGIVIKLDDKGRFYEAHVSFNEGLANETAYFLLKSDLVKKYGNPFRDYKEKTIRFALWKICTTDKSCDFIDLDSHDKSEVGIIFSSARAKDENKKREKMLNKLADDIKKEEMGTKRVQ